MKKYLIIGLMILLGTNIIALSGVAFNRMGEPTAQLTLTERELSLPYNNRAEKENSGISLSIDWRIPTKEGEEYRSWAAKEINITKNEILALGFDPLDMKDNYWAESKELYWALELNGALYKAEVEKATTAYQMALATFEGDSNENNNRKQKETSKSLKREKTANSRLFFIEASADYESLATKFSEQKNILIVKGLIKPYFTKRHNSYRLLLKHLSVEHIMVPLEYSEVFLNPKSLAKGKTVHYSVDIKWGNRLEPWVVGAK